MVWHNRAITGWLFVASCIAIPQDLRSEPPLETSPARPEKRICVVIGVAGEPSFGDDFRQAGECWRSASGALPCTILDGSLSVDSLLTESEPQSSRTHRDRLMQWIVEEESDAVEHWLIFVGHGTFDGKFSFLNLLGPDISNQELADAVAKRPGKWIIVLGAASSAPFLNSLSGPERIVITATKSGSEQNYSRFGLFLAQSIADPAADLDHDHSISLLEAFLTGSQKTQDYYESRGLLATEQALLDDNGDRRGTPSVFYRGSRAVKAPAEGAALDGDLARRTFLVAESSIQSLSADAMGRLEELERELDALRGNKDAMNEDEYYHQLESLFLKMAGLRGMKQESP